MSTGPIREVYEKYKDRYMPWEEPDLSSARLSPVYRICAELWAAIRAHVAQAERVCVWTPCRFLGIVVNNAWYTGCTGSDVHDARDYAWCPYCRSKIERKEEPGQ